MESYGSQIFRLHIWRAPPLSGRKALPTAAPTGALDECRFVGPSLPDSGNTARNERNWFALSVHFSDGSVLEVFAARLLVNP